MKDMGVADVILGMKFIAIPGLPLLYHGPDLCPWMLVVDFYLVYFLFTTYMSYSMCWAVLFQGG